MVFTLTPPSPIKGEGIKPCPERSEGSTYTFAEVLLTFMKKITLYDTTLRDGTQAEGVSFSPQDKI
ncbi:MAG TPA: hypothetical protein ACFYD1_07710, partial [Candidatus Hypogeohydataceae bacterium YC38]